MLLLGDVVWHPLLFKIKVGWYLFCGFCPTYTSDLEWQEGFDRLCMNMLVKMCMMLVVQRPGASCACNFQIKNGDAIYSYRSIAVFLQITSR